MAQLPPAIRHDIFTAYIHPILAVPMPALAMAPKTTILAFCTLFITSLKHTLQIPTNTTIPELLLALNIQHPWDRIETTFHKNMEKLSQLGLSINQPNKSTPQLNLAFHMITKNKVPLDQPALELAKVILQLPND